MKRVEREGERREREGLRDCMSACARDQHRSSARSGGRGRQAGRLAGRLEERDRTTNHLNKPTTTDQEQARESRIVESWEANLLQKSVLWLVQTW